jgi:hypothetical protein
MKDNIGDPPCKDCITLAICRTKLDMLCSDPFTPIDKKCDLLRHYRFHDRLINGKYLLFREPQSVIKERLMKAFSIKLEWRHGEAWEVKTV